MARNPKKSGGRARQEDFRRYADPVRDDLLAIVNAGHLELQPLRKERRRPQAARNRKLFTHFAQVTPAVKAALKATELPHRIPPGDPGVYLFPFIAAATFLSRAIERWCSSGHDLKVFVGAAFDGRQKLQKWDDLKIHPSSRALWKSNMGAARELINAVIYADPAWLARLSICKNRAARSLTHPYFTQRSIRRQQFCSDDCRRAFHKQRASAQ